MIQYYDDIRFDPAAPVLDVHISSAGDPSIRIASLALLDTGADVTVLPSGAAHQLGLSLAGSALVTGINAEMEPIQVWRAVIETVLGRFDVDAVEIGETTILGRDILNQLSLHFDGPRQTVRF
jgi:predicted aspartyl protease